MAVAMTEELQAELQSNNTCSEGYRGPSVWRGTGSWRGQQQSLSDGSSPGTRSVCHLGSFFSLRYCCLSVTGEGRGRVFISLILPSILLRWNLEKLQ